MALADPFSPVHTMISFLTNLCLTSLSTSRSSSSATWSRLTYSNSSDAEYRKAYHHFPARLHHPLVGVLHLPGLQERFRSEPVRLGFCQSCDCIQSQEQHGESNQDVLYRVRVYHRLSPISKLNLYKIRSVWMDIVIVGVDFVGLLLAVRFEVRWQLLILGAV